MVEQMSSLLDSIGAEWILWLLFILSVASIAIIVERWSFLRRRKVDIDAISQQLSQSNDSSDALLVKSGRSVALSVRGRSRAAAGAPLGSAARGKARLQGGEPGRLRTRGWAEVLTADGDNPDWQFLKTAASPLLNLLVSNQALFKKARKTAPYTVLQERGLALLTEIARKERDG